MAAMISKDVQFLLDHPGGRGMVVSCYADTSVSEGFESHWLQPFKAEASRVRQRLANDHQARAEFERNLAAIRQSLDSSEARHARGMAVFSAAEQGLFLELPSMVPFENRLVVGEEPYVVALLEADIGRRGYLVVLSDTHRARWYAATPGESRLLGEIDESVPKKQHPSAPSIERHRRDHILHFQKELARRLEKAWGADAYQGIVLLGEHEVLENFRSLLPPRLEARVVHEASHAWFEGQAAIDAKFSAVLDEARVKEEARVLKDLDGRLHEATAVAAGPQEVLDSLKNGQVAALVLGPDVGATASRCTGCHTVFAAPHGDCPYCHAPCQTRNLWQEVLTLAIRHRIWVRRVHPSATLATHGGIAALLARSEPRWGPDTGAADEPAKPAKHHP